MRTSLLVVSALGLVGLSSGLGAPVGALSWMALTAAAGGAWSVPRPTTIPDLGSNINAGTLRGAGVEGVVFLVRRVCIYMHVHLHSRVHLQPQLHGMMQKQCDAAAAH